MYFADDAQPVYMATNQVSSGLKRRLKLTEKNWKLEVVKISKHVKMSTLRDGDQNGDDTLSVLI